MSAFLLPAEFNIYAAESCHAALLTWLQELDPQGEGIRPLTVDGSQVVQVDASGLQILLSLKASGLAWELLAPSEVLKKACSDFGLHFLNTH